MDIEAKLNELADKIANEGFLLRAADVRAGAAEVARQRHEIERLESKIDRMQSALWQIAQWARAYPLKVFPEPDLALAAAILAADGRVSLDAISASSMRHVVEGVGKIATAALAEAAPTAGPSPSSAVARS